MARTLFNKRSKQQNEREIYRDDRVFAGIDIDNPASELDGGKLAEGTENFISYGRYGRGRNGTKLWSDTILPPLPERTGITATKTGYIISASSGSFVAGDAGKFFVWGADDDNDEITEFISDAQVKTKNSSEKQGSGCWIRNKVNGNLAHKRLKKILLHIDSRLFISDNFITQYREISCASYDKLADFKSFMEESENQAFVFCRGAGFRVVMDVAQPYYYRINEPPIEDRIDEINEQSNEFHYGYRYTVSMSRIMGYIPVRDRMTGKVGAQLAVIQQETGTYLPDEQYEDYSDVWLTEPIGEGTDTYGVLTGNTLQAPYDTIEGWAAIADAMSFNININNFGTYEIVVPQQYPDSMAEVAEEIQAVLQDKFPTATCSFVEDHFIITSGRIKDGVISYVTAGTAVGTTDISAFLRMRAADGASLNNSALVNTPQAIQYLRMPGIENSSGSILQRQWTHYSVWRNLSMLDGDPVTSIQNDKSKMIWCKDVRICGAFYASKLVGGLVTASIGEFEKADEGCALDWDNGDRDIIMQYVDSTHVRVSLGSDYYEDGQLGACAVGRGRVFRASQDNYTVTRTHGSFFTEDDVGKTLFFANGFFSIITEYIDENTVKVLDSTYNEIQGATCDPTYRVFTDDRSDDTLRNLSAGFLLKQRFFRNIPDMSLGAITPGLMFCSAINGNRIYYCDITSRPLAGYYNPQFQEEYIEDGIRLIISEPEYVLIFCIQSTYVIATNQVDFATVPEHGDVVTVVTGKKMIDNIGVTNVGSVSRRDIGQLIMITSEPSVKIFDGFSFSKDNYAENAVMKIIERMSNISVSQCFDDEWLIWGALKED